MKISNTPFSFPPHEVLSYTAFDTQHFIPGVTTRLRYFAKSPDPDYYTQSNLYGMGTFPAPQAFLIRTIRVFGLRQRNLMGLLELQIGAKTYDRSPLWRYVYNREKTPPRIPLMIPAQMFFKIELVWDRFQNITASDLAIPAWPIQVAMTGDLLRPTQ